MPVLPGLNSFATKKTTVDEKADLSFEEWYEAITLVTKSLVILIFVYYIFSLVKRG